MCSRIVCTCVIITVCVWELMFTSTSGNCTLQNFRMWGQIYNSFLKVHFENLLCFILLGMYVGWKMVKENFDTKFQSISLDNYFELRYQISQECKSELNFWLPQILDCLYSKVLGTLLQFCLKCYLHIIWSEMGEKVILTSINTTFVTNLLLILPTRVLPRMRSRTKANCKNFEAWGIGNTKSLSLCHTTTALS